MAVYMLAVAGCVEGRDEGQHDIDDSENWPAECGADPFDPACERILREICEINTDQNDCEAAPEMVAAGASRKVVCAWAATLQLAADSCAIVDVEWGCEATDELSVGCGPCVVSPEESVSKWTANEGARRLVSLPCRVTETGSGLLGGPLGYDASFSPCRPNTSPPMPVVCECVPRTCEYSD